MRTAAPCTAESTRHWQPVASGGRSARQDGRQANGRKVLAVPAFMASTVTGSPSRSPWPSANRTSARAVEPDSRNASCRATNSFRQAVSRPRRASARSTRACASALYPRPSLAGWPAAGDVPAAARTSAPASDAARRSKRHRPVSRANFSAGARGMLAVDTARRAGDRAIDDGLGQDDVLAEADARQQGAVGDAGGGDDDVAGGHLRHVVLLVGIGDAHAGARSPFSSVGRGSAGPASGRRRSAAPPPPARPRARRRCRDRGRCRSSRAWWCRSRRPRRRRSIRRIEAPVRRTAAIRSAWRGRSMMRTLISRGLTPLALASASMLSAGDASRSTTPGGSRGRWRSCPCRRRAR